MNIRLEYLYRDAGNFKNWGEVVFSNPLNINTELITLMAEKVLIEQPYFVAINAGVPDLHFKDYNEQIDHNWHEIYAFQSTDDAPNDSQGRNIEEFIESLRYASMM